MAGRAVAPMASIETAGLGNTPTVRSCNLQCDSPRNIKKGLKTRNSTEYRVLYS